MYSVVLMVALGTGGELPACHRCHGGCYGGCYGGGCYGGGCYGGGCYGGGCYGGGCYGGGYGGCYGGYASYSSGCCAPATTEGAPAPQQNKGKNKNKNKNKNKDQNQDQDKDAQVLDRSLRGTVVVSLPADAKLMINNVATKSTSAKRRFISPALQQGRSYTYVFTAEVVRDGKPVVVSKRVKVRAGAETRVRFEIPVTSVALK
jgi:uncharacterized protein (TIGR03000 family)